MGRPVCELKRTITNREFREYIAHWDNEPFGDEVRMMAQVCWMIYTANGGQKQKRLKVEDFMPRRVRQQSEDAVAGTLLAWAESMQAAGKAE